MATVATPPAISLTSISVGNKQIENPNNLKVLKDKINAFVEANPALFQDPGNFRLVLRGDTIKLERKEGDEYKEVPRTDPAPAAAEPSAASVPTTAPAAPDATTTSVNDSWKTLKTEIHDFAINQLHPRSTFSNNSCFLDSTFALIANIPSLRKKFETTPVGKELFSGRSVNGNDIRSKFPQDSLVTTTAGGDPGEFLQALVKDSGIKLASLTMHSDNDAITQDELDRCSNEVRAQFLAVQDFKEITLKLSSSSSEGASIDLQSLFNNYERDQTIDIPDYAEGSGARQYTYSRKIDFSKPLWIEVERKKADNSKDKRPLNAPFQLTNEDDRPISQLRGFIVHLGDDGGNGHYVAYYQKLNYETSEYVWYKDDDLKPNGPESITQNEAQEASKLATHVCYEPTQVQPDDEDNV